MIVKIIIELKNKKKEIFLLYKSNDHYYDNTIDLGTRISHQHRSIFNRSETKRPTNKCHDHDTGWHRPKLQCIASSGKLIFLFILPASSLSPSFQSFQPCFSHIPGRLFFSNGRKTHVNSRKAPLATHCTALGSGVRCWNVSRMSAVSSRGTN